MVFFRIGIRKREQHPSRSLLFFLLLLFCWTQYPEGASAIRPDKNKGILAWSDVAEFALHIRRGFDLVTIDFHDHVTTGKTGVVCGAARLHIGDYCAVDLAG